MVVVDRSAIVGHPAAMMYALVQDIESYPKFLPWCSGAEVASREPGRTVATLHVLYHGIRQHFTTENVNIPDERIEMRLVSGALRHLQGVWTFQPLGKEASKVGCRLEYQLASGLLDRAIGPVFGHIANSFVEVFVRRADWLSRAA
ncbi:MAG: ubiquinone-binding protein [Betaproteobacteria bacterium RBG_16_64_9]|nr:MAG: ubiquinone-binding protein [Betaproteobacteria bacterium RBG_16_64_9]